MIGTLTQYALRHRPIALALLLLFILAGSLSFERLPVEAYPDVTNVQVQLITLFPGHAAEEEAEPSSAISAVSAFGHKRPPTKFGFRAVPGPQSSGLPLST